MRVLSCSLVVAAAFLAASAARAEEGREVPNEILKELSYLVGTWRTEGRTGTEKAEGTWSARWARGKHCLIEQSSYSPVGQSEKVSSAGVLGWDSAKKRIVHHNFWGNGECYTLCWTPTPSGDWEGELRGVEAGQEFTTSCKLTKKGPDKWIYESKNAAGEEIEVLFTKVPDEMGEKAKNKSR